MVRGCGMQGHCRTDKQPTGWSVGVLAGGGGAQMLCPELWLRLSLSSPRTRKEVSGTPILQRRTLQLREDRELPRIIQEQWQD